MTRFAKNINKRNNVPFESYIRRVKWMKKKKKKTCKSWSTNFMSFYYIQLLLILVRNIIMPGEYIIYDNTR